MPFDPYALPDAPVIRVDIVLDDDGTERVRVDGREVTPHRGESARTAAIRDIAGLVEELQEAERAAGATTSPARSGVRARLNGPGFADYDIAVDRDGRLYVPIGPSTVMPPGTRPAAGPPAPVPVPSRSRWAAARPGGDPPGPSAAVTPAESTAAGVPEASAAPSALDGGPAGQRPVAGGGGTGVRTPQDTPWSLTFLDAPGKPATPAGSGGRDREGEAPAARRPTASALAAVARSTTPGQATPATAAPAVSGATPAAATDRSALTGNDTGGRHDADTATELARLLPVTPESLPADRLSRLVRASRELRPEARDTPADVPAEDDAYSEHPPATRRPGHAGHAAHTGRLGHPRRLRIGRATLAVVLAALLVIGAAAVITYALLNPRDARPGATATGAQFPGEVAPGWSSTPRWVSPVIETGGGRVLAVGDTIAYVRADHTLDLVDATTGAPRWSAKLPAGDIANGLAATTIDGSQVVAVQVGDTLAWWGVTDGAPGALELPAGAQVTYLGDAPLVGIDARTVGVVSGGDLRQVRVPARAFPLAADERGRVTAASPAGWWHLRPQVAPRAVTPWERASPDDEASDADPHVVGYLGNSVLLLFPPDRTGSPHVVAYTDTGEVPRVSFRGRAQPVDARTQPWWPSPADTWGVLGRTQVDLRSGAVADLGGWTTTWITADRAYGTLDGHTVQAGPQVERAELGKNATVPELVTPAGAAVRAAGASGERIYLLPPADD